MARHDEGGGLLSMLATVAAAAWLIAIAYLAWRGWPHVSLDLSAKDPATQAAHQAAVARHAAIHAALAIVPAAVLVLIARLIANRRR